VLDEGAAVVLDELDGIEVVLEELVELELGSAVDEVVDVEGVMEEVGKAVLEDMD
jgi:hypothetical protein